MVPHRVVKYKKLVCDVTAAILVFQDKRILMRSLCQVSQYGRHPLSYLVPWGMDANVLTFLGMIDDANSEEFSHLDNCRSFQS